MTNGSDRPGPSWRKPQPNVPVALIAAMPPLGESLNPPMGTDGSEPLGTVEQTSGPESVAIVEVVSAPNHLGTNRLGR
jgi:hypothetical protein